MYAYKYITVLVYINIIMSRTVLKNSIAKRKLSTIIGQIK